jgi:hypothetical protein
MITFDLKSTRTCTDKFSTAREIADDGGSVVLTHQRLKCGNQYFGVEVFNPRWDVREGWLYQTDISGLVGVPEMGMRKVSYCDISKAWRLIGL